MTPLSEDLKRTTQLEYLLAEGVSLVIESDAQSLAATLQKRLQDLCEDGDKITSVGLSETDIAGRRADLRHFLADLLLMHLVSMFHFRLATSLGYAQETTAPPLEKLVAQRIPKIASTNYEWWFGDLILLAELRNAFLHSTGIVTLPNKRLKDAGWSEELLQKENCLSQRSFADVLRFKRCVRTGANRLEL